MLINNIILLFQHHCVFILCLVNYIEMPWFTSYSPELLEPLRDCVDNIRHIEKYKKREVKGKKVYHEVWNC